MLAKRMIFDRDQVLSILSIVHFCPYFTFHSLQLPTHIEHIMLLATDTNPPVYQKFKSKKGEPFVSLPTHVSKENDDRFVLWTDIQLASKDINSLIYFVGKKSLVYG